MNAWRSAHDRQCMAVSAWRSAYGGQRMAVSAWRSCMVIMHGGRSSHGGQRIAVSAWRSAGSRSSIHLKKYVSHQRSSRGDETSQAVGISGNIHNATTTIHRDPVEKALRDGRWDGMCDGEQEPHVCKEIYSDVHTLYQVPLGPLPSALTRPTAHNMQRKRHPSLEARRVARIG